MAGHVAAAARGVCRPGHSPAQRVNAADTASISTFPPATAVPCSPTSTITAALQIGEGAVLILGVGNSVICKIDPDAHAHVLKGTLQPAPGTFAGRGICYGAGLLWVAAVLYRYAR